MSDEHILTGLISFQGGVLGRQFTDDELLLLLRIYATALELTRKRMFYGDTDQWAIRKYLDGLEMLLDEYLGRKLDKERKERLA